MTWRCLYLFTLTLALVPTTGWAITANVPSAADTFVMPLNSANNYGGAGALAVSASGLPKGEIHSLLRFSLASALSDFDQAFGSGNWVLDGASLQLTAAFSNNAIFNTSAAGQIAADWLADDTWVEGSGSPMSLSTTGFSFDLLPALVANGSEGLGLFAFNGSVSDTATYNLAISPGFLADVQAGSLLSILLSPGDAVVSGVFNSRNFATVANRPVLILSAIQVPEPASMGLVFSAIIGSLLVRPRFSESH